MSFISCDSTSDSDNDDNETSDKTKVYKYDGSVQCENNGTSLNEMALELMNSDITVYCSQKNYDGLAYASVCGGNSGRINVYLINNYDLTTSEALEFKSVSELTDYINKDCD